MPDRTTEALRKDADKIATLLDKTNFEGDIINMEISEVTYDWFDRIFSEAPSPSEIDIFSKAPDMAFLISELSAKLRQREWQNISTAPKDGTEILITTESEVYLASWKYNNWLPVSQDNYYAEWDDFKEGVIIKWQALPTPPKKED